MDCSIRSGLLAHPGKPVVLKPAPGALRRVVGSPNLRREVEGQVLIAQEHQPSPPELYVRLLTHTALTESPTFCLVCTGCMPNPRGPIHRNLRDESSGGMFYRQEFVSGS